MQAQTFSSGMGPEAHRPRAFESTLSSLFSVELAVSPTDDKPFVSEMLAYRSGRLHVARLGFSPHRTFFAGAARTRASNLLVSIHREGEVQVSQNDRDARILPGDIFVIDPSRPFEIQTGEIDTYSVYLPRARLREIAPHLESMTAYPISTDKGAGSVFRNLLETVFKAAPELTDEAADQLADAFPPALAAAMGSVGETEVLPTRIKLMHRHRVRRYVMDNLHDAQLDVDQIARGVGLSARHLHELFRDQPVSLMKWVWAARLKRCREDLCDPGHRCLPVGEIAYAWGFSDLAHFSRSFRQRYGQSPRQFRSSFD